MILGSIALGTALGASPARAEALIVVEADSGKVLRAENATYPWYPASTSKLMTLYVTLSAIRDGRITQDTLFTVSPNASAQSPTKMGFPIGTQVTVDNALKMMMVKSANDMAVVLAEGIGGSIDDFAQQMTETAHRLGMTESNFVNPNGLPADGQIMSARDLAILARALIHEFPQYSFYWHVPAIKYGRRIVRNYNPLLGRYRGADGMKTGFICASGFNMVATATRDNKQLIAVVLGAPSSPARAVKAAEILEGGFQQKPLSWLTPSLGTVDQLAPIDATPPNLKDAMCGPHRKRPATEEDDPDAPDDSGNGAPSADASAPPSQFSVLLSALRAPTAKNLALLPDPGPVVPTIVYTGPTRSQAQIDALAALPPGPDPALKKTKKTAAKADIKALLAKPDGKLIIAKPEPKAAAATPAADKATTTGQIKTGKPTGSAVHYTPSSSSASATPASTSSTAQKKPKPAPASQAQ
ncbi:MAG TPA: D-alanyl-D-alanine carboxypeptidase family protein [Xanthobacteraceae bacterium]|nr:D-alanyl-D-alanine carboxypeptidase family protein [Xanthobacteraceae bacterium]